MVLFHALELDESAVLINVWKTQGKQSGLMRLCLCSFSRCVGNYNSPTSQTCIHSIHVFLCKLQVRDMTEQGLRVRVCVCFPTLTCPQCCCHTKLPSGDLRCDIHRLQRVRMIGTKKNRAALYPVNPATSSCWKCIVAVNLLQRGP